jgi:hypothetical protein
MREIKFRVWVYGQMDYDIIWPYLEDEPLHNYFKDTSHQIMQYTGLKDKNGKEIYEGDIVSGGVYYGWVKEKGLAVVRFGVFEQDGSGGEYSPSNCLGWYLELLVSDFGREYETVSLVEEPQKNKMLKVIGNIYENPELLEDKE